MSEFLPQRTSAYISQVDNHIGELTVRETLDFAAQVQGTGYKYGNFFISIYFVVLRMYRRSNSCLYLLEILSRFILV